MSRMLQMHTISLKMVRTWISTLINYFETHFRSLSNLKEGSRVGEPLLSSLEELKVSLKDGYRMILVVVATNRRI